MDGKVSAVVILEAVISEVVVSMVDAMEEGVVVEEGDVMEEVEEVVEDCQYTMVWGHELVVC